MPPIGCVCSEKKVEETGQADAAATSKTKIFFIGIPQNRNSKYGQRNSQASMQWFRWRRRPAGSLLFPSAPTPLLRCRRNLSAQGAPAAAASCLQEQFPLPC